MFEVQLNSFPLNGLKVRRKSKPFVITSPMFHNLFKLPEAVEVDKLLIALVVFVW